MMVDGGTPGPETPKQPGHSPSNRREFPRAKVSTALKYREVNELGTNVHPGVLTDLNAGGLQFTGERRIESGARLELHLKLLSQSQPYRITGEIVWVRDARSGLTEYGVQFIDVTPDQQFEIDELVRFLMQAPHPEGS